MADEEIGTTLVFDVDHYADYERHERVAEAVIECANRRVDYLYDIFTEGEDKTLEVQAKYYNGGELVNQSNHAQTYDTDGDRVYHTDKGQEIQEFVEANAFADVEVTLTDEYDSMVF